MCVCVCFFFSALQAFSGASLVGVMVATSEYRRVFVFMYYRFLITCNPDSLFLWFVFGAEREPSPSPDVDTLMFVGYHKSWGLTVFILFGLS